MSSHESVLSIVTFAW